MSDFTIEFWYTRTSAFSEGTRTTFLFTSELNPSYTNNLVLSLFMPWKPAMGSLNFGTYYCILFGIRINSTNQKEVNLMYDFGSMETFNSIIPLNIPVHIAVAKRNSDGEMRIFLNGVRLPAVYTSFNEPYFTADTSWIANKTGYFPYNTYLGNYSSLTTNEYPARGIIENLKIYDSFKLDFNITAP